MSGAERQSELFSCPNPPPDTAVGINDWCVIRTRDGYRVVLVSGVARAHYSVGDQMAEASATVSLVEQGWVDQNDVVRAFGCSARTVRRYQRRFAGGGLAALGRGSDNPQGRRRLQRSQVQFVLRWKSAGLSNREVARRLGVCENAVPLRVHVPRAGVLLAATKATSASSGRRPSQAIPIDDEPPAGRAASPRHRGRGRSSYRVVDFYVTLVRTKRRRPMVGSEVCVRPPAGRPLRLMMLLPDRPFQSRRGGCSHVSGDAGLRRRYNLGESILKDSESIHDFLMKYRDYVEDILEPSRRDLKTVLAKWMEPGHWSSYTPFERLPDPSPVQRVHTRIKRPESVADKILRRAHDFTDGLASTSFRKMNDTLGARAVVYFLSQFPLLDKEIRSGGFFEVSSEIPPIAYLSQDLTTQLALGHIERREKDSGYASVHYILRLTESSVPRENRPWFELQVRTLCEDIWGEIEHILGYKPGKRTSFAVRKQFRIISQLLEAIDQHFNFLFEELGRFQEEAIFSDSDPLNAENLPAVLSQIGVGCAQKEIDGLLKVLVSRGVGSVGALRSVATDRRLTLIRNTYRLEEGRAPINFEVVANLGNLVDMIDEAEMVERIKSQIAFLRVWDQVRKEAFSRAR